MLKCPFYPNSIGPCPTDCLFNRVGGCAVVLAALNSVDNNKVLKELQNDLSSVKSHVSQIEFDIRQIKNK